MKVYVVMYESYNEHYICGVFATMVGAINYIKNDCDHTLENTKYGEYVYWDPGLGAFARYYVIERELIES